MRNSCIEEGGNVRIGRFSDMEAQAEELIGYDQNYRQMTRGRFEGEFVSVFLGGATAVYVETVNQIIESSSVVPEGQVAALFLLGGAAPARLGRRELHAGDIGVFSQGSTIDFNNALDSKVCVVTASLDQATGASIELQGRAFMERAQSRWIRAGSAAGRRLHGVASSCLLHALGKTKMFEIGQQRSAAATILSRRFAELLAETGANAAGDEARLDSYSRRRAYCRARDLIHAELENGITVEALLMALPVSRRSLEYAFNQEIGMGPAAYIATCRLNAVRKALRESGETIGDIAARYGIWHLGRLAALYRRQFGELPSVTRSQHKAGLS